MYLILFILLILLGCVSIYQKKKNAVCKSTKQLNGKTVIVTGGTLGIGLRIALDFAQRGAKTIIACPYEKEGTNARRIIIQKTGNRNVIYKCLDLADLQSVRDFANDILKTEDRLDILVNNAGVGVVGDFLTKDGMNIIMQVNYYGHFLLTILLLPLLSKTGTESEKSRIVNATSFLRGHGSLDVENYNRVNYWNTISIYSNSKLAVVLFSTALTRRLHNHNVVINNANPGVVATRIYETLTIVIGYVLKRIIYVFFKSPWEGAQTAIHVALDDFAGRVSGQVFEDCKNGPIVTVKEGKVRGSVGTLFDGSIFYSFKGIPFASPPVADLRFKAPIPPSSWIGIREATNFGPICTQYTSNATYQGTQGQEDCLYLNVYTKSLNENAKTPVMVFIYGGSFTEGSANTYGPQFLIQHDIILVTFNYRLEVLGFLSLDTPEVPGNAAMKDQVAALKWVQSNIAKFGGDPNNVSIFGESAGAMCVFLHMLSPMSNGLFHKAIAQSGTYELATTTGAKERAFRAGKLLGKNTSDVNELLSFFRNLKADRLTNLTIATFTANETYRGLIAKFLPVVEKKFSGIESFLDEDPTKLILEGKLNRVPFMLGYNSGEGIIVVKYHISLLDIYNNDPSLYVPKEIYEKVSPKQLLDFGRRIKNFFVSGRNITDKDLSIIRDIHTDIFFAYTTHRLAYLYTSLCKETYMYRFDLVTELNIIKSDLGLTNLEGVSHFEDIFYMFNNNFNQELYKEKQEIRDVVYKVTKLWTNFAKTGRPTPDKSIEAMWQPYTVSGKEYFKIDQPFALDHYADRRRMKFWNELYKEAGLLYISDK